MARFVPSVVPDRVSSGELKVWRGLETLDDGWTVFFGLEWQGDRDGQPDDGEADFVLVNANYGLLVMEVKGGGISVQEGEWHSIDRDQRRHHIKNPFSQVQQSKRALLRHIRSRLGRIPRIPVGHAVVFPDLRRLPDLGPQAPEEICWREQEVRDAGVAIEALCDHWKLGPPMRHDLANAICEALAPTGMERPRMVDDIVRVNAQIVAWTQEQAIVLDAARENPRLLIYGGAGSGKTVLATEEAARLALAGESVLLTCFNRPLADHLEAELEDIPGLTVRNFHRLIRDTVLRAQQANGSQRFRFPERPTTLFWEEESPALLVDAAAEISLEFDAIIVDEGQDFSPAWWDALDLLLSEPGVGRLYVFADTHQNVYRRDWVPPFEGPILRLIRNCRNTRQIASRVSAVWGEDPDVRGPFGRDPEFIEVENFEGAASVLRPMLHTLMNEESVRPDQITVLCQYVGDAEALIGRRMAGIALDAFRSPSTILVETIHRFKGLESDAVILLMYDAGSPEGRLLAYTGLSRAIATLYVIGSQECRADLNW